MKTNVMVFVDDRRKANTGHCDVYLVVSRGRNGKFLLNTGLKSDCKFSGREFPKTESNFRAKSSKLNRLFEDVEDYCLRNEGMPMKELKDSLQESFFGKSKAITPFVYYMRLYANSKANEGTKRLYEQTIRKIEAFDYGCTLESMDAKWLHRFDDFCAQTMSVNGKAILLRNIRAVFNWCIDNEYTDKYPFRKFKIRHEKTRKRNLIAEQVRQLRDCHVEKWQEEYRDMFLLMIYLIGINISDLLNIKRLTGGRCVYRRRKTGRLYDIKVQPEAMAIIEKYKGKDYLLSPLDRYKDCHDYLHHMNDALKKIGKVERKGKRMVYKPLFPDLTSYWSRHTWATIAASLDIPKETIGKALGHSEWDSTTTDIYIDFDSKKIDEANRKVIDYLNEK